VATEARATPVIAGPELLAKGRPAEAYLLSWAIYRWIPGQPYADELVEDERQASAPVTLLPT
jgi:hypothetical protein